MSDRQKQIFWQAHRVGGGYDMPDNTIAAVKYGWDLGGIPEVDIRLTADNKLICLHDDTLARTTDAPGDIAGIPARELSSDVIRRYDAGTKFDPKFRGEKVPFLEEVFILAKEDPSRRIYADIKDYSEKTTAPMSAAFGRLVAKHGVAEQIIVCSCDLKTNNELKAMAQGLKAMLWIGSWPDNMRRKFQEAADIGFEGLCQVQLHLADTQPDGSGWRYNVPPEYLTEALALTSKHGVSFQLFPFQFDRESIVALLDLGITWFTTDEPSRFSDIIKSWRASC